VPRARGLTESASAAPDDLDGLRRELARGVVELATLASLRSGRRYAYELLTLLNGLTRGAPEIKEGTLYPLLHRLEDAGHITSSWEAHDRARPRKFYSLTASGRSRLERLKSEWSRVVDGVTHLLAATGRGRS
jgi:DNA-binding PadR family transcriptional regulator